MLTRFSRRLHRTYFSGTYTEFPCKNLCPEIILKHGRPIVWTFCGWQITFDLKQCTCALKMKTSTFTYLAASTVWNNFT